MLASWWNLSNDTVMLAVEAQSVMAMRLTSIALGRGTHAENTRMVSEKAAAFAEAAITLANGGSPHEVFVAIGDMFGPTVAACDGDNAAALEPGPDSTEIKPPRFEPMTRLR